MNNNDMKIIWHRVWGLAFILMGTGCFWAGLTMWLLGDVDGRGLVVWSGLFPLFCGGMFWAMVKAEDREEV